ncbi:uncharacterized protein LOC120536782 isoform X1 [Polypterus senegalus]|uniref:uncharacterized protein LOC120536782 isoform X1 n=1 Tax=Polypterus senegalus TaxID=55291 RepID=UPI0019641481|nr:uncharacterized protein LOC120536782 isoform X1 [Polypterus senegalus]
MEPANTINGSMTITISFPKSYPRSEDLPDTFNIESKDHYQLFQKRKPYISGVIHITVGMLTLCLGLVVFLGSDDIVFPVLSLFNILSLLNGGLAICSSVVRKTCVVKWFIAINICNLLWSVGVFMVTTINYQSEIPFFDSLLYVLFVMAWSSSIALYHAGLHAGHFAWMTSILCLWFTWNILRNLHSQAMKMAWGGFSAKLLRQTRKVHFAQRNQEIKVN